MSQEPLLSGTVRSNEGIPGQCPTCFGCPIDARKHPTGLSDGMFAMLKSDRMRVVQATSTPGGRAPNGSD